MFIFYNIKEIKFSLNLFVVFLCYDLIIKMYMLFNFWDNENSDK